MTDDGSSFDGRAIFVVGSPRSGTTWLVRMLASHPAVAPFPGDESHLFTSLARIWRTSGADDAAVTAAVRRYCDRLLRAARDVTGGPGATHVVEKTPAHVHELAGIGRVYPHAWFVHILRDGRDVARSLLEFEHGPDSITDCAALWRRAVLAAWSEGPTLHRHREVRYECLLDDPVGGVRDVLEWIGLPVDAATTAAIADAAGRRVSQHNTTGAVGSGTWRALDGTHLAQIDASPATYWRERATPDIDHSRQNRAVSPTGLNRPISPRRWCER